MALTITWGTDAPWTWSPGLPSTATLKRALGIAEPFLTLGAEAAGAGVPELMVVLAAVAAVKHVLSQTGPAGPDPAPTSSPATPGPAVCAA